MPLPTLRPGNDAGLDLGRFGGYVHRARGDAPTHRHGKLTFLEVAFYLPAYPAQIPIPTGRNRFPPCRGGVENLRTVGQFQPQDLQPLRPSLLLDAVAPDGRAARQLVRAQEADAVTVPQVG